MNVFVIWEANGGGDYVLTNVSDHEPTFSKPDRVTGAKPVAMTTNQRLAVRMLRELLNMQKEQPT